MAVRACLARRVFIPLAAVRMLLDPAAAREIQEG